MKQANIDLGTTRSTVINWPNELKQIVDGYRSWESISHGVQKDAIQNGWDARIDKKSAKGWKTEFELLESEHGTILAFTDCGTTGLTGQVLTEGELELDLPIEERWGRFENIAFTKAPTEHALGARGRGKFIFLGSSAFRGETKDKKAIQNLIVYDTLRADGIYRLGYRTITATDSRIGSHDAEEAVQKLQELTWGLVSPLENIGTRVMIIDPLQELVETIKNGDFATFVQDTWWQIIRDHNVPIAVKWDGHCENITLPNLLSLPTTYPNRFTLTQKTRVPLPGAPNYFINELAIIHDADGVVPERFRGIWLQRGGMKICSLDVKNIEKSIANAIYGFVVLDDNLEDKIREDEGPEHYSYDFKKMVPRLVKQFVEDECETFLRDKLGVYDGAKPKPLEKTRSAEVKALYQINKIANQLGIIGAKGLLTRRTVQGTVVQRPVRLTYGTFTFPNDVPRVDLGQSISGVKLEVVNSMKIEQRIGIRFSIQFDDRDETIVFVNNLHKEIEPSSSQSIFGPHILLITKDLFRSKGKYSFFAKLVSLNDESKGEILHELRKNFWVGENPPLKGIFDEIEKFEFPQEKAQLMGFAERSATPGYTFCYNTAHPAKRAVEDDEDRFTKYLIELMGYELAWIDLRSPESKLFSPSEREDPAQLIRSVSRILGQIRYEINL